MNVTIAPSLLAADANAWGREIEDIISESITCLHLDIMDGRFVPNLSFGPGPVGMLRKRSKGQIEFDAHLMVVEPEKLIPAFVEADVDGITVHYEACVHLHRIIESIKEHKIKAGVAINPATPVEMLEPMLPYVDRVLVMTVNPGFGGQSAILSMLKKAEWLKEKKQRDGLAFEIQADGGVNLKNISSFIGAGVENIVIGSALFKPGKTKENIREFKQMTSSEVKNC